jgi:carboxyl-terminal processing protease
MITLPILTAACSALAPEPTPTATIDPASLASPTPNPNLTVFESIWETINENYVYEDFGGADWDSIRTEYSQRVGNTATAADFEALMEEMLAELPSDTVYWTTRSERIQAEAQAQQTAEYQGIGAFVGYSDDPQPHLVLLTVIAGSPAEEAGLKAHDSIYAVDGQPVTAEENFNTVERVRGPAGTVVELTVQSPNQGRRVVPVTRGPVRSDQPGTFFAAFLGDSNVLYMFVPRVVNPLLINAVAQALQDQSEIRDIEAIVIDLRVASNGNGWPLLEMLNTFTDGPVGDSYDRVETFPIEIQGQDILGSQELPIAIIVGPDTHGYPEVFTGAMQSNPRVTVFGLPSAGFTEGLEYYAMPDGSELSVSFSSFINTDGVDIGRNGVQPDVVIDVYWDSVTETDDDVIQAVLNFFVEPESDETS